MIQRITGRIAALCVVYSSLIAPLAALPGHDSGAKAETAIVESEETLRWSEISRLKIGSRIRIHGFDGRIRTGRYLGLEPVPDEEYVRRFSLVDKPDPNEPTLSALGESISLDDAFGKSYSGEFLGFDKGRLLLRLDGAATASLIDLRLVRAIRSAGQGEVDPKPLIAKLEKGHIPFRSLLVWQTKEGRIKAPLEELAFVTAGGREGASKTIVLAVIGAAIGGLFSYLVYRTIKDERGTWHQTYFLW